MRTGLRQIQVPHLIRLKSGALGRLPIYLQRERFRRPLLMVSEGLPPSITGEVRRHIDFQEEETVRDNTVEGVESNLRTAAGRFDAVVGLGGGKALDVAKYAAFRLDLPYIAVPTSLSHDGFCSPRASLTTKGRRRSFDARLPSGVVVDLDVVRQAPPELWLSGVGDLVSKRTAIHDWKLAFHQVGTPFDDLAALLSDASVFQFLGHPQRDELGIKLLAQALLLNGVAMEVAGNSRPASGSEHLISHALDQISPRPRLHGLQVGLATYWMARVQGQDVEPLDRLFEAVGFWSYWQSDPLDRLELEKALEMAPTVKDDFVTVLSDAKAREEARGWLDRDPRLAGCLA